MKNFSEKQFNTICTYGVLATSVCVRDVYGTQRLRGAICPPLSYQSTIPPYSNSSNFLYLYPFAYAHNTNTPYDTNTDAITNTPNIVIFTPPLCYRLNVNTYFII